MSLFDERWEKGLPHHDASKRIMNILCLSDTDDYFDWNVGGDGDNGEALQYRLDEYFERHPVEPVLPCCEVMRSQLLMKCEQHGDECPDQVVRKGTSGKLFLVAANATYDLLFCPWCGAHVQMAHTSA